MIFGASGIVNREFEAKARDVAQDTMSCPAGMPRYPRQVVHHQEKHLIKQGPFRKCAEAKVLRVAGERFIKNHCLIRLLKTWHYLGQL